MPFPCCIANAKNTLTEYVIIIAFPLQQWLDECASVLSYTYNARLCYGTSRGKTHFIGT